MPTIRQSIMATITRRYPLLSGCGRLANSRLLQWLAGGSNEVAWARIAGGAQVLAPLDDFVGRAAFYVGDLDRKITAIGRRLIRPGDTVLDIGANIGVVAFAFASLVGVAGHVHAFEPNPELVKLLHAAVERNGTKNVTVHAMALGQEEGELELSVPRGNAGGASLVRRGDPTGKRVVVPVKQLSSVIRDTGIGPLRLVKIDVEGFEPQVLAGARQSFRTNPPDAVLFELNDVSGPVSAHPTLQILQEMGYVFYGLPKAWVSLRLARFEPSACTALRYHDLLAVHRDKEEEIVGLVS